MIGTPGVNLHSPGPIGDVTPSTLAGTTLTTQAIVAAASTAKATFTGTSGASYVINEETGFGFTIQGNGTVFARITFGGLSIPQGSFVITGATYASNVARYVLTDGVSGIGIPAANQVSLAPAGNDKLIAKATTINIVSLPTSSAGLVSGDLYSTANAVMIVP